jgi:hypothetical protein
LKLGLPKPLLSGLVKPRLSLFFANSQAGMR